jgi:serine/threonine protein kinase
MNPLTPALSAYIVAQAANGLGYAHNLADSEGRPLGVVHRDVSPQNILVSFEGAVKVIDFGIVRALGRVSQTNPGGLKGKIEYMAPEQASSEDVDRRADVFALGIVLWEAVTGRHLFRRDTELATMRAIVDEPIPPPSDITPVHPQLEQIIVRALEKKREDRFQTSQEMALALERYAFSQEGFSPLQLANYVKELFDTDLAQWKKTVSSALDIEVKPGAFAKDSGRFPVLKPDLPTRGPTVALRPGSSSSVRPGAPGSDGVGRTAITDLGADAPTRRDWIWVGSGVAAVATIALAGWIVLSRPRVLRPALPAPAPTQWQGTPPAPTPPSTTPAPMAPAMAPSPTAPQTPPGPAPRTEARSAAEGAPKGVTEEVVAKQADEPLAKQADKPLVRSADKPPGKQAAEASPASRSHTDKGHPRSHGPARRAPTQAPAVPSDHRPNPFD